MRFNSAWGMDPANIVSQERDSIISFPILRTKPKAARMRPEPALTRATPILSNSAIGGQAGLARMLRGASTAFNRGMAAFLQDARANHVPGVGEKEQSRTVVQLSELLGLLGLLSNVHRNLREERDDSGTRA